MWMARSCCFKKAIFINSVDSLCMTKADVLDTFENISVCVAYDDNNLPIYKNSKDGKRILVNAAHMTNFQKN